MLLPAKRMWIKVKCLHIGTNRKVGMRWWKRRSRGVVETDHVIFNINLPRNFCCVPLMRDDIVIANSFIECTRHIDEIHQLSAIFRFDLELLLSNYTPMTSGEVLKKGKPAVSPDDFIAINAIAISIISAGSTLVDSLECYIKTHCSGHILNTFKDASGRIFDTVFEYKLLSQLRNYSQHGHIPLGIQSKKYCFDLYQIFNTPHLKLNAVAKRDFINYSRSIMEDYHDTPTLSFTLTLARYVEQISKLESLFYTLTEKQFFELNKAFLEISDKYKNNILRKKSSNNFIFKNSEGEHQMAIDYDKSIQMFHQYKKEAHEAYMKDLEKANYLFEGIRIVYPEKTE